jgi:hypothetical protein
MWSVDSQLTFRRNMELPSSVSKNKPIKKLARMQLASKAALDILLGTLRSLKKIFSPSLHAKGAYCHILPDLSRSTFSSHLRHSGVTLLHPLWELHINIRKLTYFRKSYWWWILIYFGINGILNFVHCATALKIQNTKFRKFGVSVFRWRGETCYTMWLVP